MDMLQSPCRGKRYIRLYNMKEENILGDYKEDPTRYDLMRIAVINLDLSPDIRTDEKTKGEYYNEDVDNTMKILSRLFKSHEGTRKILDGIRELGVEMTPTMTKEAEDMAYVGDAPYTQGWDEGREEGLKKGLKKGREEGLKKGREEGVAAEKLSVARQMITDGVAFETISKYTGLSAERIEKLKNS